MSSGPVAKAKLLAKTEDYILTNGLLDLTLTAIADGIGSNRRMLLYHFTSLEKLVQEAIQDLLVRADLTKRLAAILSAKGDVVLRLDEAWAHLADPSQEAWHRIFFAQLGLAFEDPVHYEVFLRESRAGWPALLEEEFSHRGISQARELALGVSSVWSGLQLHLLSGASKTDLALVHHESVSALLSRIPNRD